MIFLYTKMANIRKDIRHFDFLFIRKNCQLSIVN
jgi:hypothetical protein